MKAISQFVVHVFDLIEAEGAALRTIVRAEARRVQMATTNVALGVAFLLISIPLIVAGAGLIAAGLMWWLETQVSRPLAASLTGLIVIGVGISSLLGFKLIAGKHQP